MAQAVAMVMVSAAASILIGGWTAKNEKFENPQNTGGGDPAANAPRVEPNSYRNVAVRQSLPPRQFVYGSCRIGGAVFYQDNDNPHLYIGCALSDGPIDSIIDVYYGAERIIMATHSGNAAVAVDGTIYTDNFSLSYKLGTSDQEADTLIADAPAVPADFWRRGVACAVVKMHWGADAATHSVLWGQSVSPSFFGRFKTVYDPRDVAQDIDDPTTWVYSDNPALCVANALTTAWGVALDPDYIDWDSVGDAADVCDEVITYQENSVATFTLSGVFKSDTDMAGQIQRMLDTFRGVITFSDGLYKIVADAPRTSVWTVTDDDILEVQEYVHSASITQAFGSIKASFYDSGDAGRQSQTEPYDDAIAIAAGETRETAIDLPFCPTSHAAQILAYRKLKELRSGRRLTLRVSDAAIALDAFEVITVASASAPMFDGEYQVDLIDMAETGYILQLREYVPTMYGDPEGYLV